VSGAPIESPEQDTLDRGRLAQALATSLRGYGSAQNLVVGLYGPWGSGKTSLLNMAAGAIAEPKDGSEPIITRFNPWNFTDQDQLTSEFFDALSNAIDRPDLGSQYTEASTLIQKFGRRLQPLSAIPHLGTLIDVALRGSEVVSLGLQREGDKLRDLEVAKADISKALLDLERRTIVIIDDIDRLTNEEIRRLFQLVKSTADFSNVIYLLAFDKAIVTKALSGVQGGDDATYGESYLEKIVNVPIDIPKISN
jgi:predicted KAP-like P-loop ATPase